MKITKHQLRNLSVLTILVLGLYGFTGQKYPGLQNNATQTDIGKISLEMNTIEWNGNIVEHDSVFIFNLKPGENLFVIYQNEKLACLAQFIYKRTSSKIQLSTRTIVELSDGKRYFNPLIKNSFETDNSNTEGFSGKVNETVTYDRKTMSTVMVNFNYRLN